MPKPLSFAIPFPPLFSFKECLWFLNRDFDDCMHRIADGQLYKALEIDGQEILIRISEQEDALQVDLLQGNHTAALEAALTVFIKDWFDMDRDIAPFYKLLCKEKKLAYMAEAYSGLQLVAIPELFEAMGWGIIGQQINLTFAYKLKRRLTERFGKKLLYKNTPHYIFPAPSVLAAASVEALREMQYSQKKAEYITDLAKVFADGTISKALLQSMSSFAAQQQALTALRGIGIWTANYALMKSMRIAEAIPYGDVGLLQALVNHKLIRDRKDQQGIDRLFRRFKGWESHLVFYLWRSLSESPEQ